MIGTRIKQRRKELGLTQSAVGRSIGVSKATVSLWENDVTAPNGANLQALAKVLQQSAEWILTGKEPNEIREGVALYHAQPLEGIPLIEQAEIGRYLSGDFKPKKNDCTNSRMIAAASCAGKQTFAFISASEGMSPRIEPGDTIFIDPDQQDSKPGREVWLFKVGNGYELGAVAETPRGLMLRFDKQAPGWEPMPVKKEDCAGKVVAFRPSWLN